VLVPRYFTPRLSPEPARAPGPVSYPLDVLAFEATHRPPAEWVVGFDDLGALSAQPTQPAEELTATTRAQLAYHEVAGGTRRGLRLPGLHLFQIELCEQAPDSPGFDDPVYLYGTLVGPMAAAGGPLMALEGQLTVTRADLLEAAVQGAQHAFRYGAAAGEAQTGRSFHLLLPADRPEDVARGAGIVLAYPVLPAEVHAASPGNEAFFNQILYDLIAALWGDVQREDPPPRRRPEDLPVPDRSLHEAQLQSQGFAIDGDSASRPRQGLLASVLGPLAHERRKLPPEGTTEQYLELAREALQAVPGWPAARAQALRGFLRAGGERAGAPLPYPPPPPPPPPRRRDPGQPPAWMEDFIAGHARPGAARPQVTSARTSRPTPPAPRPEKKGGSGRPEWMSDFAPGPAREPAARAQEQEQEQEQKDDAPAPPAKPDWMKDFD
jgi:hypothetical protein